MMKYKIFIFILFCALLGAASNVPAVPLDLSGFTADPLVSENGGIITFVEDIYYGAIYFYNDYFDVPVDAGNLSFNYELLLGPDQQAEDENGNPITLYNDDYLVAVINFTNYLMEVNTTGTGSWIIDLSNYQGQQISLAFGLESNDQISGTTATISTLDLAPVSVPEPNTSILLVIGVTGLAWLFRFRWKKAII